MATSTPAGTDDVDGNAWRATSTAPPQRGRCFSDELGEPVGIPVNVGRITADVAQPDCWTFRTFDLRRWGVFLNSATRREAFVVQVADLYTEQVLPGEPLRFENVNISPGEPLQIDIHITGKNEAADPRYMVGIDRIEVETAKKPAGD